MHFYQRIFPGVWSTRDVCFVSDRNCDWNPGCVVVSENTVPWRCGSVCHGAAKLSSAGAEKCYAAFVGESKDFLQKAFTVIFVATICIWFLQKFDLYFNLVADSKDSILAMISNCLVPIFAPLGLGDWRICTSLISGVMAKESVISTLEILFGGAVKDALTPVAAASLLVFSLLYTPCIAAIASIRRELGRKWAVGMVIWQCMIAWVAAFAVRWLMVLFMR